MISWLWGVTYRGMRKNDLLQLTTRETLDFAAACTGAGFRTSLPKPYTPILVPDQQDIKNTMETFSLDGQSEMV